MPTANYNGTDVTHIIALVNRDQQGVTLVAGERYGIDHYYEVSLNWWRIALDNNFARIMQPEEYPPPQFEFGRLRRDRQFANRRIIAVKTDQATVDQLKTLMESEHVFGNRVLFKKRNDGKTNRMAVQIRIEYDEEGNTVYPNWVVAGETAGIITHKAYVRQAIDMIKNNPQLNFILFKEGEEDTLPSDLTVVASDREVAGDVVQRYLERVNEN